MSADAKGRAIGEPEEIPQECGVLVCTRDKLEVLRNALKRTSAQLPFAVWMALAKATPIPNAEGFLETSQMGL